MPLYNAQKYLAGAIEAILSQDHSDLELILADNASTDATERICREYAARDPRVVYRRAGTNGGAIWNFNRALSLARGRYFMWAAFDDLRDRAYLTRTVAALEADQAAVMCCTALRLIDEDGQTIDESEMTHGLRPVGSLEQRVDAIARAEYWFDFYGLYRTEALRRAGPLRPIWGFDVVLTMDVCLRGPVALVPDKLFIYRIFRNKKGTQTAGTLSGSASGGAIPVSFGQLSLELTRSICRSPLPRLRRGALVGRFMWGFCVINPFARRLIAGELWNGVPALRQWAGRGEPRAEQFKRVIWTAVCGAIALPADNVARAGRLGRKIAARLALKSHLRTRPGPEASG